MSEDARQWALRNELKELLWNVKLGLVVVPSAERQNLGTEALRGLKKIILANELLEEHHHVYFDKGIVFRSPARVVEELGLNHLCEIHTDQDSRLVGGLQVADLAAHTMSVMLLDWKDSLSIQGLTQFISLNHAQTLYVTRCRNGSANATWGVFIDS